jgi:Ca-activated chloride channel homolog
MRQSFLRLRDSIAVTLLVAAPVAVMGRSAGQFATTTELVEVYATVTGPEGQPVRDMRQGEFVVLEEGVPQAISTFAAGEIPLTMAIAVDRSFSMGQRRLELARAGAQSLVRALRPDDQLMILAIGSTVETVVPLGEPDEAASRALLRLDLWGTSPIGDSVVASLNAIDEGRGRRALVLFSDGEERESQQDRTQVLQRMRRADVLAYPVAIGRDAPQLMADLAAVSGGRLVRARSRDDMGRGVAGIIEELRSQYFLGYSPAPGRPAGWRRIEVRTSREGVRIRARQGYMAD